MPATAFLKNNRQTPRKVRAVADLIKGKSVGEALTILTFIPKRAALPLKKLLQSALNNSKSTGGGENLMVKDIRVDKGLVMKRFMPRARGSAAPIRKRMSHVYLVLDEMPAPKAKKKALTATKK